MSQLSRPATVVVVGWALVAAFGALVWLAIGDGGGALFLTIALVMAVWVAVRPGTAALVVSLMLGLLVVAQQTGYLVAGLTDSSPDAGVVSGDVLGLVAGLLISGGSVAALRQGRRAPVREPAG